LASGPGLSQQGVQRLRQRIDRSIVFQFICKDSRMPTRGLTKKRMPSASFCQRSTNLLSSSSAALEYMEKSGPELSPKLDSPPDSCCDGLFCVGPVGPVWSLSLLHTFVNFGENRSKRQITHTHVVCALEVFMSSLRH
jgi:hypothetical protein